MINIIKAVKSTGSDYWAAYVGREKIKTEGLKQHTPTEVIIHWQPVMSEDPEGEM